MIVSEVMSPPDCHDDPTTQQGAWFLSERAGKAPAGPFEISVDGVPRSYREARRSGHKRKVLGVDKIGDRWSSREPREDDPAAAPLRRVR
jgi:hypothetical protein